MIIVDLLASLLLATLAGMGAGGGGLLVIYLVFAKNIPQLTAQGINLIFFISAGISSSRVNLKKRPLNKKNLIILSAAGTAGAILGAFASVHAKSSVTRFIFACFLLFSGMVEFLTAGKDESAAAESPRGGA